MNYEKESNIAEEYSDWKAPVIGGELDKKKSVEMLENEKSKLNEIFIENNISKEDGEAVISMFDVLDGRDKKEFISLLPGYFKFKKENKNLIDSLEKPLIHGTGSYSLKKIISEGFRPRKLSEIITGEKSLIKNEEDENLIPISFCDPNYQNGIEISHYYATQITSSGKLEDMLSINSEKYLENKTDQLLEYVYEGMENAIDDSIKMREEKLKEKFGDEYHELTDEQKKKSKEIAREIILNKYEMLKADDAYVFSLEKNQKKIKDLEKIIDNNQLIDLNEARRIFLETGMLTGEIEYQNKSYYQIDQIVEDLLRSARQENTYINKKIKNTIKGSETLRDKILENYNIDERNEIQNQFPVYFLVNGENKDLVEFMGIGKAKEYRCEENISNKDIKQIQVPKKFMPEVIKWVKEAGLDENVVVPFEYYEIDQIIKQKNRNYEN